jgi:hypothetical protein
MNKVYIAKASEQYWDAEDKNRHPLIHLEETYKNVTYFFPKTAKTEDLSLWNSIGWDHTKDPELPHLDRVLHKKKVKAFKGYLVDPTYEDLITLSNAYNNPIIVNNDIYFYDDRNKWEEVHRDKPFNGIKGLLIYDS